MIPKIQDPRKTCLTCALFQFNEDEDYVGPRNRQCLYPGDLVFEYGTCKMWKNMFSKTDRIKSVLHMKRLHRKSMVS